VGRPAQRGFGDAARLHVEGLQDRPGLAFALQSGFYISNVSDTANALGDGRRDDVPARCVDPDDGATPYALLDKFNDDASAQVADIMKEAGSCGWTWSSRRGHSFGNVIFLCIALFVVTLAKLFLTFVIAVGPLFILCLAWRPTARFFDSWLSMVLNAVVLTWFAFFALGLSATWGRPWFRSSRSGRLPRPDVQRRRREPSTAS
jgi:type IV secretion system protein VirB6